MTLIHQVEAHEQYEYEIDPIRGGVRRRTSDVTQQGSASAISHESGEYEIDDEGSFDVPEDVAEYFCNQPGWYRGPNPFAAQIVEQVEKANKRTRKAA